jgi:hypothetical protein
MQLNTREKFLLFFFCKISGCPPLSEMKGDLKKEHNHLKI